MTDQVFDIFRNDLAKRFGIEYVRIADGLVFVGASADGQKKWYQPSQAAQVADQINAFAKAIMATQGSQGLVAEACELALVLAEAAQKAQAMRELSKGTGDKTEQVTKQLTPLKGHAMDYSGTHKKELEGLVVLGMGMFPALTEGEVGDVMAMADVGGERKLGALKLVEWFKSGGKALNARNAVNMYDDLKAGRIVLPRMP